MDKYDFRPLTAQDVATLHGAPIAKTFRCGFALTEYGVTVAAFGLLRAPTHWVLCLDISPTWRQDLTSVAKRRVVVQGIRHLRPMLDRARVPVHTFCDETFEGARTLLEHIGFKPTANGIYTWPAPAR